MKRFGAVLATSVLAGSLVVAMATGAGAALSEKDFKKQGNAICKQGNIEIDEIANRVFADADPEQPPDAAHVEAFVAEFVPNIQGQIDEIGDLDAPKSLKKKVDAFLTEAERALGEVEDDPQLLASEESDVFAKTSKLAKKVGLKACAN